jgi:predicted HTH transcriptional regulator
LTVSYKQSHCLLDEQHKIDKYFHLILEESEYEHPFNIHHALLPNQCVVAKVEGRFQILGKMPPSYQAILDVIYQQKQLTSYEIANHLQINRTQAASHLQKLYARKLIIRENQPKAALNKKGRCYVYRSLF